MYTSEIWITRKLRRSLVQIITTWDASSCASAPLQLFLPPAPVNLQVTFKQLKTGHLDDLVIGHRNLQVSRCVTNVILLTVIL